MIVIWLFCYAVKFSDDIVGLVQKKDISPVC